MTRAFLIFLIGLIFMASSSQARVFDMGSESFASYLKLVYQPTTIQKSGFEKASPHNESYDQSLTLLYAGEFGLVYATPTVNFRFGIEIIRPPTLKDVKATDAGGTELYTLNSDVSVVIPKVGLELNMKKWKTSRLYLMASYGQGNLGMVNSYTMAAAGTTLTGKSDFTEDGRGTGTQMEGALAFEMLAFDSTSLALEVGQRTLKFDSIKHSRDTNSIAQGSVTKGAEMLNADGTARTLDFTGFFAALNFRFWVF